MRSPSNNRSTEPLSVADVTIRMVIGIASFTFTTCAYLAVVFATDAADDEEYAALLELMNTNVAAALVFAANICTLSWWGIRRPRRLSRYDLIAFSVPIALLTVVVVARIVCDRI